MKDTKGPEVMQPPEGGESPPKPVRGSRTVEVAKCPASRGSSQYLFRGLVQSMDFGVV